MYLKFGNTLVNMDNISHFYFHHEAEILYFYSGMNICTEIQMSFDDFEKVCATLEVKEIKVVNKSSR